MKISISLVLIVFISGIGLRAGAQKLPNVQQKSLRAPANVKVDGKATEWSGTFQAYNHATDIYYTICNDDQNLFAVMKVTDPEVIYQLINSGITLSIQIGTGAKVAITYPQSESRNKFYINVKDKPVIKAGDPATVAAADSFSIAANKKLQVIPAFKQIGVTGVANVDSSISIYNENKIKAAAAFDNTMTYIYELSIDLKNLGLQPGDIKTLAYKVQVNETNKAGLLDNRPGFNIVRDANGTIQSFSIAPGATPPPKGSGAATNFTGEYTLAKN